jgi:hypothetical protein
MYKFLIFSLLLTTLSAFAQNTGHPGGGPDTLTPEQIIICNTFIEVSVDLEEKFLKSWNKNYKSSQDFFKLIDYILVENLIHTLDKIKLSKNKKSYKCNKDEKHLHELKFSERPKHKDELFLLRSIKDSWEKGENGCKERFVERTRMQAQLNNLIKLYENTIQE